MNTKQVNQEEATIQPQPTLSAMEVTETHKKLSKILKRATLNDDKLRAIGYDPAMDKHTREDALNWLRLHEANAHIEYCINSSGSVNHKYAQLPLALNNTIAFDGCTGKELATISIKSAELIFLGALSDSKPVKMCLPNQRCLHHILDEVKEPAKLAMFRRLSANGELTKKLSENLLLPEQLVEKELVNYLEYGRWDHKIMPRIDESFPDLTQSYQRLHRVAMFDSNIKEKVNAMNSVDRVEATAHVFRLLSGIIKNKVIYDSISHILLSKGHAPFIVKESQGCLEFIVQKDSIGDTVNTIRDEFQRFGLPVPRLEVI